MIRRWFLAVSAIGLAAQAHGAVVQTNSQNNTNGYAFSVSSTDLVNNGQSSLTSATAGNFTGYNDGSGAANVAALGDGTMGTTTQRSVETAVTTQTSNWTLTYALNTTASPTGYTINQINTYSGWTTDYANQHYSLAYSTPLAPATFISLGTYELDSTGLSGNPAVSLEIALSSSAGPIAAGVADLQFTFMPDSVNNHYGAYREIDVIGAATTPEPASLGVLATAALGLLMRRRA